MFYTSIYNNYQIRDCTYIGEPPSDDKYRFDLVKWRDRDAQSTVYDSEGVKVMPTRYCYSIATLYFDKKEEEFKITSVGMRLIEDAPTQGVFKWIENWCRHKTIEFLDDEEWD